MPAAISSILDPSDIRQGLGALLRISPKTVSRWERGERRPTDEDLLRKMSKLKEIADLGSRVYTPEGLKEFLVTPLPVFGGHSGLDLIGLGDFETVIAALAADFEGTGF